VPARSAASCVLHRSMSGSCASGWSCASGARGVRTLCRAPAMLARVVLATPQALGIVRAWRHRLLMAAVAACAALSVWQRRGCHAPNHPGSAALKLLRAARPDSEIIFGACAALP